MGGGAFTAPLESARAIELAPKITKQPTRLVSARLRSTRPASIRRPIDATPMMQALVATDPNNS